MLVVLLLPPTSFDDDDDNDHWLSQSLYVWLALPSTTTAIIINSAHMMNTGTEHYH